MTRPKAWRRGFSLALLCLLTAPAAAQDRASAALHPEPTIADHKHAATHVRFLNGFCAMPNSNPVKSMEMSNLIDVPAREHSDLISRLAVRAGWSTSFTRERADVPALITAEKQRWADALAETGAEAPQARLMVNSAAPGVRFAVMTLPAKKIGQSDGRDVGTGWVECHLISRNPEPGFNEALKDRFETFYDYGSEAFRFWRAIDRTTGDSVTRTGTRSLSIITPPDGTEPFTILSYNTTVSLAAPAN